MYFLSKPRLGSPILNITAMLSSFHRRTDVEVEKRGGKRVLKQMERRGLSQKTENYYFTLLPRSSTTYK